MSGRTPDRCAVLASGARRLTDVAPELASAGACPCGGPVTFRPGPGCSIDVTVTHRADCAEAQPPSEALTTCPQKEPLDG